MTSKDPIVLSADQIAWLRQLKMSKRAALVRDYILEYGAVTTGKLAELGYSHPPRAARDLKDAGAGVVTIMVKGPDGRRMASYAFNGKANEDGAGRVVIPKAFGEALKRAHGGKCAVCYGDFSERELQCDHRVPFAIAGDKPKLVQEDFMPLCASDNRAKSWSCENCPNWELKDEDTCRSCFWASPENYTHVSTRPERRINLLFQGDEVEIFDALKNAAANEGVSLTEATKRKLAD
ncbi:HNH endonuclease signature motif containing protein [Streptomyces sp. NPDC004520]|uniref:SphI restriction endonuclease n=1 Tax=Streptomyces phaeochromogenes TaxID=1923 RepID=P95821_STRPH|nr:SphI restriction endonuclease [Streptomyces phaeochromogenes]